MMDTEGGAPATINPAETMRAAAVAATAQQGLLALEQAHGYRRVDDGSVLVGEADTIVLHALLLERVLARKDRAFDAADALRQRLRDAGVAVDDRDLTFKVLPKRAERPGPRAPPTQHDYRRADDASVVVSPADQQTLDALLLERLCAKLRRDFDTADRIKDTLRQAGVWVDDRERTYEVRPPRPPPPPRADGMTDDLGARHLAREEKARAAEERAARRLDQLREAEAVPDYTRDPSDDSGVALAPADEATLAQRLGSRRSAKKHRDFVSADAIRDELNAVATRCGCRLIIDDDRATYRFALIRRKEAPKDDAHGYAREEDGVDRDDAAAVDALLMDRVRAKRCRDFARADELREELRTLGVFVDDKRRTFYCREKPAPRDEAEDDGIARPWDNLQPKNDRAGLGRAPPPGGGRYGRVPPPSDLGRPMAFVRSSDAADPAAADPDPGARYRDRSRSPTVRTRRRDEADDGFPDF